MQYTLESQSWGSRDSRIPGARCSDSLTESGSPGTVRDLVPRGVSSGKMDDINPWLPHMCVHAHIHKAKGKHVIREKFKVIY